MFNLDIKRHGKWSREESGVLQLNKAKIPCRPHKACIFLSNFMFLSVLVCDSVL